MDTDLPQPRRILVATRDKAVSDALVRLLAGRGLEARAACGTSDVLKFAKEFQPRLVVLAIDSPRGDEMQTASLLRHSKHREDRITLIALSVRTDSHTVAQAHAAGFDIVVPTSVDHRLLCDLVQGAINTHSADARADDALTRVLCGAEPSA